MPIKFSREASAHLIRYVKNINIKFNPFDNRTTSARELVLQVQTKRFQKANPKLQVAVEVHNRADKPLAHVVFVDDTEEIYETPAYTAEEVLFEIYMRATQMDAEFELAGKSVDG